MEPLAPGTEDDPIDLASLRKQEAEQERLLKQKAILKNGQYDNVFELSYVHGAEHWFCKVCQCPVMGRVYQHELGKRHSYNMQVTNRHLDRNSPEPERDEPTTLIEIAPGEPAPPGFETEVHRQPQIQERLDGFKVGPLIALEYLVEMIDYDPSKEPLYLCILCDKRGDPRTVLTHLASYNHISQYLQKHFPTCYRTLAPYMTKQYKRNWQTVLQKIAEAIEKKFGRLKPFCIEKDKFEQDRVQYLTKICKGRHFSEVTGNTFQELVVHDELTKVYEDDKPDLPFAAVPNNWAGKPFIEKPFKKRSPSPPVVVRPDKKPRANPTPAPTPAPTPQSQDTKIKKPIRRPQQGRSDPIPGTRRRSLSSLSSMSSDDERNTAGKSRSGPVPGRIIRRDEPRGRDRRPSPVTDVRKRKEPESKRLPFNRDRLRRSPSPRERPTSYNSRSAREEAMSKEKDKARMEKLQEYKKLCKAIDTDMENTLKNHEKNPEKHPKYNDEWKLFWNKRYKELQAEGKDAASHDFKPEWIQFWGKRMLELHHDEMRNRKDSLRKRLGLPEEPTPIKFRIGTMQIKPKETAKSANLVPMAAQPDIDPEVIIIDEEKPSEMVKKPSKRRSHSPWERESPPPSRNKSPPARGRDKGSYGSRKSPIRDNVKSGFKPSDRRSRSRDSSKSRDRLGRDVRRRSRSIDKVPKSRRSRSIDRFSRDRRSRSRDRERISRDIRSRSIEKERTSRDRRSRSIDRITRISKERSFERRSLSREQRSAVRDVRLPYEREVLRRSRSIEREVRKTPTRERSWERDRSRRDFVRESSFERDVRRDRIRTVSELPWEREKAMLEEESWLPPVRSQYRPEFEDRFYIPPPGIMRDMGRHHGMHPMGPPGIHTVPPEAEDDNEEVNMVAVLRLLTALEERLGSLGPKVIDLLAQALALEKNEANSSETLLDNEITCVVFETVKEKLKGQLLAGLVDMLQEHAFKRAIKKTASLLHVANERRRIREKAQPKNTPVTVPGVGSVDKGAIAKQIANALIAQGKTDVTQAELEQLINAVVGMAEASKNLGKPVTTASFLEQIARGGSSSIVAAKTVEDKFKSDLMKLDLEPLSPPSPERNSTNNMENLSDSDLQTLLQNFKDLSTDEQMNLINYLKKLEVHEPERVERLRKFVNLGAKGDDKDEDKNNEEDNEEERFRDKESPFANRLTSVNPSEDDRNTGKIVHIDSEEEDYSFDDVVKAASKNVQDKEMQNNKKLVEDSIEFDKSKKEVDLSDAKALISTLMSNITKNSPNVNLLGLSSSSTATSVLNTVTSSAELSKTLNSINIASLANIVSSVQQRTSNEQQNRLEFEAPVDENRPLDDNVPGQRSIDYQRLEIDYMDSSPNMRFDSNFGGPGHNNMGRGPNDMGRGHNDMGRGSNDMGRGPNDMGRGPNDMGRGVNDMGRGPNDMGRGPNDMGRGPNDMGRGTNDMGREPNDMVRGYNDMGSGPNYMGRGPNDMGQGWGRVPNDMGIGTNNMGRGPNDMGSGPNMGRGPSDMGIGANMGRGPNDMGPRSNFMGRGPNDMGPGPNNMGPNNIGRGPMDMGSNAGRGPIGPTGYGMSNMGPGSTNMGFEDFGSGNLGGSRGGNMSFRGGPGNMGPLPINNSNNRSGIPPIRPMNPYGNGNFVPPAQNASYPSQNPRGARPIFGNNGNRDGFGAGSGGGGNQRFGGPQNRSNNFNRW